MGAKNRYLPTPPRPTSRGEGFIKAIRPDKGYAFIAVLDDDDLFAHANEFSPELEWNEQLLNRRVIFDIVRTDRGRRAENVRPAE